MKERRLLFLESHVTQSVWQGAYDFVIPERTARLTGSSLVMNRIFNVQSLRQFSLLSTLCMYMSRIKVAPYSVIAACCEKLKALLLLNGSYGLCEIWWLLNRCPRQTLDVSRTIACLSAQRTTIERNCFLLLLTNQSDLSDGRSLRSTRSKLQLRSRTAVPAKTVPACSQSRWPSSCRTRWILLPLVER